MDSKKFLCVTVLGVTGLAAWHEAAEPADDRHPHTHQESPASDTFRLPSPTVVASGVVPGTPYGLPGLSR
jgi:hypothetical protein